MVRPTRERQEIPFRRSGVFGWDPGSTDTVADPVDRAIEAVVEMPVPVSVAFVQEGDDNGGLADSCVVVLGAPPTAGNLLVAVVSGRSGFPPTISTPAGWTLLESFSSTAFDGGGAHLYYRFAGESESATVDEFVTGGYVAHLYVAEFSGIASLDASDGGSAVSATTSLTTGPLAASEGVDLVVFAAFVQAARSASFTWGSGFTELHEDLLDASGPAMTAGWEQVSGASGTQTATATSGESDGYGWAIASFLTTDRNWSLAPETQDEEDATYRASSITGAFWRAMLLDDFVIGSVRALIGFSSAASRTVVLQGATDALFTSPVSLASVTLTSTGSYTGDELLFTVATPGAYQFYRLVASGAYDMRVYTVELYDRSSSAGEPIADAHVADTTDAHDASAISVLDTGGNFTGTNVEDVLAELAAMGGPDTDLVTVSASGAAETIDVSVARAYDVTLTDDCSLSLTGGVFGERWEVQLFLRQDPIGGRTVNWPASVVWGDGGPPTLSTTPSELDIVELVTLDAGVTWFGSWGGGASVSALDDLSDVTITSPATGQKLRYNGSAWVNANLHDEPMIASDGSVMVTGALNPMMHEVAW